MLESIRVSAQLPVSPQQLYRPWLDSREHTAFTGDTAHIDPTVGGKFTAGDGYIQGTTVELQPYRRIVQTWRSTDFPAESADSRLEVLLEEADGATTITLLHSDIPESQGEMYAQGWVDFYLKPMKRYFAAKARRGPARS